MTHKLDLNIPPNSTVLVLEGQNITPDTIIFRSKKTGDKVRIPVAEQLQVSTEQMSKYLQVKVGDKVKVGEILAKLRWMFGLIDEHVQSYTDGVVESILLNEGVIEIRTPYTYKDYPSYLNGVVYKILDDKIEVIVDKKPISAKVGFGPTVWGRLGEDIFYVCQGEEILSLIKDNPSLKGIICYQVTPNLIKSIYNCQNPLINLENEDLNLSIVILDNFGNSNMPLEYQQIFKDKLNSQVTLFPKTQVRAGSVRPYVVFFRS